MARLRGPFDTALPPVAGWLIPVLSVMAGSLLTLIPWIASFPVLPPFGLLLLLGWRLGRPNALPIWSALPLGMFDDLFSGQPFGSAIFLWSVSALIIDLLEQRLVSRDFRQDWLLAAAAIAVCIIIGRLAAAPIEARVDIAIGLQIIVSIMLYPLTATLCAMLNRERTLV